MSDSTWYHGGVPGLEVGGRILPPDITGATTRLSRFAESIGAPHGTRTDVVYLASNQDHARAFAALYPDGALYQVEPESDVEPDPDAPEVAAMLATCGPDVLAAAIGAVQWCAGRLLRDGVDAATAMSAGRPGSWEWEAAAMRRVIDGGSAYVEPADIIARVGAILHGWVTGRYYAEVAENYAAAASAAAYAIGLDTVDLYTIAEHCDPTDRHTGAAGWLTSRVDSYSITAPGAEA